MQRLGVWVWAIAATGLLACKSRQASVDQTRAAKAAAPEPELEEKTIIPASEHARLRQRLVGALTKHPDAYLTLRGETPSLDLRPRVAAPISLRLAVPGLDRWTDANVGRFVVRYGGTQETVAYDKPDSKGLVSYTFSKAGPAMFMFCAGPKVELRGALWEKVTHCSKVIVDVTEGQSQVSAPEVNVTSEGGLPIEVTPMIAPVDLRVGSELPATFSLFNEELEDLDVAALRPDGTIEHEQTDNKGMARFQISQPGRWVIRFVKTEGEIERVGELVFAVSEAK